MSAPAATDIPKPLEIMWRVTGEISGAQSLLFAGDIHMPPFLLRLKIAEIVQHHSARVYGSPQ